MKRGGAIGPTVSATVRVQKEHCCCCRVPQQSSIY